MLSSYVVSELSTWGNQNESEDKMIGIENNPISVPTKEDIASNPELSFQNLTRIFSDFLEVTSEFNSITKNQDPDQCGIIKSLAYNGDQMWNTLVNMFFSDVSKPIFGLASYAKWNTQRKNICISNKLMKGLCEFLYRNNFSFKRPSWVKEHSWGTAFEAYFFLFFKSYPEYAKALVITVCSLIFPPETHAVDDERILRRILDAFIDRIKHI